MPLPVPDGLGPGGTDLAGTGLDAGTGDGAGTAGGLSSGGATGTTGGTTGRTTTAGGATGSTSGGTSSGGTGSTGGTGTGTGTGTGSGGAAAGSSGPGNTTGISATQIDIGVHAPETNAAPVPVDSFNKGANLFWRNHLVNGKKVVAHPQDDQYSPSVARQVCESQASKYFMVIGGAGTDQIQACASDRVLQSANTPYLSGGVTTNGLTGINTYFAVSETYRDQGRQIVTNARNQGWSGKWAIVATGTANFDDAVAGIRRMPSPMTATASLPPNRP